MNAFSVLKEKLIDSPIMIARYWYLPSKKIYDNFAKGAVLGQYKDKHFQPIHYASKTLIDTQENYTATEKELLAVVFEFDKFCS